MLHYISGTIVDCGSGNILIKNDTLGVIAQYNGIQNKTGEFFLFPYMDDNLKTVHYFAFDSLVQKQAFTDMLKISGVGPKTAFGIANMDQNLLKTAVDNFDVKPLQAIPGVGPKTAKRLLVELKSTLTKADVDKLAIDEKLFKSIVQSLKSYGYDANMIKKKLRDCPHTLDKDNLQDILKWLIKEL